MAAPLSPSFLLAFLPHSLPATKRVEYPRHRSGGTMGNKTDICSSSRELTFTWGKQTINKQLSFQVVL